MLHEKLKTLRLLFMDGFNCLKATEPLQEDSLLFTTQSSGVLGRHLINWDIMEG